MKQTITILMLTVLAGCASYEVITEDKLARANWEMSFRRQWLDLRQEPVPVPQEYKTGTDQVVSEIKQDGFMCGWDDAMRFPRYSGILPGAPESIIADKELSSLWHAAYNVGFSNGSIRVKAYWRERKDNPTR